VLGRLGLRANANVRGLTEGLDSLGDSDTRRAFVHTARSVIDSGGQRVRATNRLDLADQLPVLIAWGTEDRMIPVEHAHRAHELILGSELALFEGAGHFPHCDRPGDFAERLLDFLDRRPPGVWDPDQLARRIADHTQFDD
jgi:pimeloyl-ACP methyl ester carboxylesterase